MACSARCNLRAIVLLFSAVLGASVAALPDVADQSAAVAAPQQPMPMVCVVVRTYWGHGGDTATQQRQGLRHLLTSLQRQSNPNWEAVLVVMDSEPFRDLHYILQDIGDDRMWVYAEWIGREFTPRQNGVWTGGYHEKLYSLTDDAIRACPESTEWVVVTNGDNDYASSFFSRIGQVQGADLIAFDYYSRYHRSTAVPCERFGWQEGAHTCKVNKLKWCRTDLGANVMRWRRLLLEDRRFGALGPQTAGLAAEHFDGIMAQELGAAWPVEHVRDCLYDHSPTPQRCARQGGVWDDSDMGQTNIGGRCLNSWQASKRLKDGRGAVEELTVQLGHDPHLAGFDRDGEAGVTAMRCLRQRNVTQQRYELMTYFGTMCSEDVDLPDFDNPEYQQVSDRIKKSLEEAAAQAAANSVQKVAPPPPGANATYEAKFRDLLFAS